MSAPSIKKFDPLKIPDTVEDLVVYHDNETIVTTEKRDLVQHWGKETYIITESVCHKFVKTVIQGGKLAVFNLLLAGGFQMHVSDLIYLACQFGHLPLVRVIMDTGRVEVDNQTKYGWTPLEIAAVNGRTEIVRLLVKTYKANVNLDGKYSPLENAIEGGHLDTVKEMVQLGARYSQGILAGKVDYLKSSAKLVYHQGELINRGDDYDQIVDFLMASQMSVMHF